MSDKLIGSWSILGGGVFMAAAIWEADRGEGGPAFWLALTGGIGILVGMKILRGPR